MSFPLNVYVILDMNIQKTTAALRLPISVLILINMTKPQYIVSVTLVKPILNVFDGTYACNCDAGYESDDAKVNDESENC